METKKPGDIKFFNYGKSFVITKNNKENTPRFLIEAKCTMGDQEYYLCAPCKGEHTYAEKNLFEEKAFEFTPIFHKEETLIFRRFGFFNNLELNEYKKAYIGEDVWGERKFFIKEVKAKKLLDTTEKIIKAVKSGTPIMGRIIIKENTCAGNLKFLFTTATIDFPVKTINVADNKWQVDTGPIPFPDLKMKTPYQIFIFDLAYVAFNHFGRLEALARGLSKFGDYFIVSPCRFLAIEKPEIYLYSL